jgi:hypothetical protein
MDFTVIRNISQVVTHRIGSEITTGTGAADIGVTGLSIDRSLSLGHDNAMPVSAVASVDFDVTLSAGASFLLSLSVETSRDGVTGWLPVSTTGFIPAIGRRLLPLDYRVV